MTLYFERVTGVAYEAEAHIQTSCQPSQAADEFSWDHPDFRGRLEVIVQELNQGRPRLTVLLLQVEGPGQVATLHGPLTIPPAVNPSYRLPTDSTESVCLKITGA